MLARLRRRLSYANVMATLAFFLALSTGGAYAANTIFSEDIVDGQVKTQDLDGGAVTSEKAKDNSLAGRDVLDNTLKGADIDESTLSSIGGGGPAGGDLTGSYPNPQIAAGAVGRPQLNPGAFFAGDIAALQTQFHIPPDAIQRSEIDTNAVASKQLPHLLERAGATITIDGGEAANGDWGSGTATAACSAGEDLISGYGQWTSNSPGQQLAITEVDVDYNADSVIAVGISDSGAEGFRAVAVCMPS